MSYANSFRNAIRSFNGADFTKEQLKQLLDRTVSDNHLFEKYFKDFLKRTINGFRIVSKSNGLYNIQDNTENEGSDESNNEKRRLEDIHHCSENRLTNDDALKIFIYTLKKFDCLVEANKIKNSKNYFTKSDVHFLAPTNPSTHPMEFIFKQLAFHAQNGTNIESIIEWKNNETFIESTTNRYNCSLPLSVSRKDFTNHFVSDREDVLNSYYDCLNDIRLFLSSHPSPASVRSALYDLDPRAIFKNMHNNIKNRYGIALTFDFVKEFGRVFGLSGFDYPKPDLHIKRNIAFIRYANMGNGGFLSRHKTTDFDTNKINSFETIDYYVGLMDKARASYNAHGGAQIGKLTNYLLDKMIFIICSGKFYLNDLYIGRKEGVEYTKGLGNKYYSSIGIHTEMPYLETFLHSI